MPAPPSSHPAEPGWRALPGGIWALGLVSLFMDISSEMIHSLLPIFMVSVLPLVGSNFIHPPAWCCWQPRPCC